jgi:hypothetical protein
MSTSFAIKSTSNSLFRSNFHVHQWQYEEYRLMLDDFALEQVLDLAGPD